MDFITRSLFAQSVAVEFDRGNAAPLETMLDLYRIYHSTSVDTAVAICFLLHVHKQPSEHSY